MRRIIIQNLIISFSSKGVNFLLLVFFARLLNKEEFGLYAYINLIIAYLPLLHLGSFNGMGIELPRFHHRYKIHRTHSLLLSYFSFSGFIQILVGFLIFLIFKNINLKIALFAFLYFVFMKGSEGLKLYLVSTLQLQKNNILKLFSDLLGPLAALASFVIAQKIEAIYLGYSVLHGMIFIYFILFFHKKLVLKTISHKTIIIYLKLIYRSGFPVFLAWGMDVLFTSLDRFFISQFYDLKYLADYSFSNSFASLLFLGSLAFSTPYGQILYKHAAKKELKPIKSLMKHTHKRICISGIILAALIFIFYPGILSFTGKYHNTIPILTWLLPVHFMMGFCTLYVYFMNSHYKTGLLIQFQLFALLLNLLLNTGISVLKLDIMYFAISTFLTILIYLIQLRHFFRNFQG
jgi:O-antigen/teichoic acid export membrane protein